MRILNQERLAAHGNISGRGAIVDILKTGLEAADPSHNMAGADTDGTDGPGGCFADGAGEVACLAGGIVDGWTVAEAEAAGVDILDALQRHNTSQALWKLDSGIAATHNIAIGDLGVTLIR